MTQNEVLVFCDSGSNKHGVKHPTPAVQGFTYRGDSHRDELGMGWTDTNRSKRLITARAHLDAAQALVANERFNRDEHWGMERRESWALECKKCGAMVRVRSEKLYPALTRLLEIGISRIGISEIQRGLERTGANY